MSYNILIVDDSRTARAIVAKMLRISQMPAVAIMEASSVTSALEVLRKEWIDLVITDIYMPELTGLDLVRRMQADDFLKTVPIVVASAEGSTVRVEELMQLGVKGYLRKPFTPEELMESVKGVLGDQFENNFC